MPVGMIFWILWLFCFLGWGWGTWYGGPSWAPWIFILAMFFFLGWHDFGFIVH
jgi:hypothetical protein